MLRKLVFSMCVTVMSISSVSCISMSSLQTAEILKEGEGRVLLGGGYYTSPSLNKDLKDAKDSGKVETNLDDIKIPYLEVGYRRGLSESFELGFKYTIPGALGIDGKYSLLNQDNFDLALGLGLGYFSIESGGSSTSQDSSNSGSGSSSTTSTSDAKSKSTVFDLTLPIYMSYRINDSFALYTSPKYILRSVSSSVTENGKTTKSSGKTPMAGATVGAMIGTDKGFGIEVTYAKGIGGDFNLMQVAGAMYY